MINPATTYRIQFNKDFTFEHLKEIIPYLKDLGITTIYASPVFEAVPGSVHGYDVTNPLRINHEIGTEDELREISQLLKKHGMYWLQDIVPNHMAYHPNNDWLMDVLEKGARSPYAEFFDTVWTSDVMTGALMVPFLGKTLDEVTSAKELELHFEGGKFFIHYFENKYPVCTNLYAPLLKEVPVYTDSLVQLLRQIEEAEQLQDNNSFAERWREIHLQIHALVNDENICNAIQAVLAHINSTPAALRKFGDNESYRMCHWQETEQHINYRRFFTINSLICLNIQHPQVFEKHHELVKKYCEEKIFDGLRIDHIDGLHNPTQYQEQLRRLVGEQVFIVVEKILAHNERLPTTWHLQGTTGYDFLSMVNNLLTYNDAEIALTKTYQKFTGIDASPEKEMLEKKRLILYKYMQGELENLTRQFLESNILSEEVLQKTSIEDVKFLIGEILVAFPVYRNYGDKFPLNKSEAKQFAGMLDGIAAHHHQVQELAFQLKNFFLESAASLDSDRLTRMTAFYQRLMQFTGPLMAKGVEDSLMYTYNRFIGHNEVGDHPDYFGISTDDFHLHMQQRQKHWPLALNATATHDTKRGEDARARINVLTQMDTAWEKQLWHWKKINEPISGKYRIKANDEYLVYEVLMAHHPFGASSDTDFKARLLQFIEKALREGKESSDWSQPNIHYEEAVKSFATEILDSKSFKKSFGNFLESMVDHGIVNSLSQLILKFTCPGVPDIYQGCELWDFSFVDPDNRRAVDFDSRKNMLKKIATNPQHLHELWPKRTTGDIKLQLTETLSSLRRKWPVLFTEGKYISLETRGSYAENLVAFSRVYGDQAFIIIVPLYTSRICTAQNCEIKDINWKDTSIVLPDQFNNPLHALLQHKTIAGGKQLSAEDVLKKLPFAILHTTVEREQPRGAGILMSISSLPSAYGVGDVGLEAEQFVRFLHDAKQQLWQLLPVNPVEQGQSFSPYSATSGMAGNILYISIEGLQAQGLLDASDLEQKNPFSNRANFLAAEKIKLPLLKKAFNSFKVNKHPLSNAFEKYCRKEAFWLDDFAAFSLIRQLQGHRPWYEWPEAFKLHHAKAISLLKEYDSQLEMIKWFQFIFHLQWQQLKETCRKHHIRMIGDLPFYVSYDSADVWANREIFSLDKNGNRKGMAGVPPDAFSEDGQLWGMPVYDWKALKKQNYKWWIQRIEKNLELYDLVRIDHFRAIESYWEVPQGAATAKDGCWREGPAHQFFEALKKHFGKLPFLAEDLGDVNDKVFALRDAYKLPGMKVLQFAFGNDLPDSPHIPHNYIQNAVAYTGTHDNNTSRGWFSTEADQKVKQQLEVYTGLQINEENAADVLCRMAYASVANTVIVPMQDVLNLDESARMNRPSTTDGNWTWSVIPEQIDPAFAGKLAAWVKLYNRSAV